MYNQEHKEEQRAYKKKYYQEHREEVNLKDRIKGWDRKLKVIEILGGRCRNCGITDARVLQINHINGGGNKEYIAHRTTSTFYNRILSGERDTKDLELLCANCNILYEYERGQRYDGGQNEDNTN